MVGYARAIVTMAQNLISMTAANPNLHENKFYMMWNAILNHHFPVSLEYGVAPQTSVTETGPKLEFLVVKVAREQESIVLVVELKKPKEDNTAGRATVKAELVKYVEEHFDETQFHTIYAIGGIGLSWIVYKMQKSGPPEPESSWIGPVTSRALLLTSLCKALQND